MKSEILVIEDDQLLSRLIAHQLVRAGHAAESVNSWAEAESYLSKHDPGLLILDPKLPDADGYALLPKLVTQKPVIVLTAYGSVQGAVRAIKSGAAEYLVKPVNLEQLELEVERVLEKEALRRDHQFVKDQLRSLRRGRLIGNSSALQEVRRLIEAVAATDMTVLILGESGAGKELTANEIHEQSERGDRHFMTVDCCTLHESLLEAELFGHERGAFTGADRQKKGLIEVADGGTLFFDEITEIPPPIQTKLLRVIETGCYRRLGGTRDLPANVRIIAASNHDLEKSDGRLGDGRSNLYYGLSAFIIKMPPLRARRGDIPPMVEDLIDKHNLSIRVKKRVLPDAMAQLVAYDWPGNIRELKNVVERAVIISGHLSELRPEHFPRLQGGDHAAITLSFNHEPTMEEIEKSYLELLISRYGGHRRKVSSALGISERTTYRLLERYGLQH
jgi:DNA-binding NtrC family response regulator